ncbi:hypothetical protein [Mycobacterium sp. Aquia_213]|uniref:hypothetical protein n=1 Tax=Mycobacterium sp. Aquia_213 TaxID=2991728 RepID=UPI00227188FA|nr:hypothetical protein [Mycobacterium sp. Aquia_213]WAC90223.1 hypothetical protein LMQ14_20150 [Mycobacterium sp. Aquia_213]
MNPDPSHWVGRLTGWCFNILAAAIALWCAVKLITAMWPTLATIVGIATIFVVIIRIVVYYTSQKY